MKDKRLTKLTTHFPLSFVKDIGVYVGVNAKHFLVQNNLTVEVKTKIKVARKMTFKINICNDVLPICHPRTGKVIFSV